jgi:Xaa-Pro aminopeptidase
LDVGCVYDGYGSDLTRTWVVGKSTEAQKRIARHLAEVHDKILALMKPGVTLGEIFDFRRKEVRNSGCITDMAAMPAMPANGSGLGGVTIHRIGLGPCMIHPT